MATPGSSYAAAVARAEAFAPTYRQTLHAMGFAPDERVVDTAIGRTHLLVFGQPDGPPLVALHGGGSAGLTWSFEAAALGARHRVYAPDMPGHYGLSAARTPVRRPEVAVRWLTELLDALALPRVDLLGVSLGGGLAAELALAAPERVARLMLIAPAVTLRPMRWSFYLHTFPLALGARPATWERFLRWLGPSDNAGRPDYEERLSLAVRFSVAGHRHFGLGEIFYPRLFTDDELGRLRMPSLVMAGEHEVIWDARAALARAAACLPEVRTEVVAGAGHDLLYAQPERVSAILASFLSSGGAGAGISPA